MYLKNYSKNLKVPILFIYPLSCYGGKSSWDLYRNVLIVYYRTENVALV